MKHYIPGLGRVELDKVSFVGELIDGRGFEIIVDGQRSVIPSIDLKIDGMKVVYNDLLTAWLHET